MLCVYSYNIHLTKGASPGGARPNRAGERDRETFSWLSHRRLLFVIFLASHEFAIAGREPVVPNHAGIGLCDHETRVEPPGFELVVSIEVAG